jgi:DMSO/TMAO reductase YedYZ molybdopterin-dependent catalytic subunit
MRRGEVLIFIQGNKAMNKGIPEPTASIIKRIARRLFFKMAGGLLFMANDLSSGFAFVVKNLLVRTVEKDAFEFNARTGLIEWKANKTEEYRLTVDGLVKERKIFSYNELRSFPQVEQVSDFHCVEGWSVQDIIWGGFRVKEIMNRVVPDPKASHIVFHSFGQTSSEPKGQQHYIESFPISELLDPKREALLVLNMNHSPLPEDHGAPLRLIAPYDLAYKSIKYVSRIEFAQGAQPGWWTLANPIYEIEARVPANRLRKKN